MTARTASRPYDCILRAAIRTWVLDFKMPCCAVVFHVVRMRNRFGGVVHDR